MRQRTSIALQPASECAQVFFGAVVLDQAGPQPTAGIIDHGDQLTSRAALLQPTKRGAILHHHLSKTGPPFAPHVNDPRQSKIVELRFFGGLSVEETSEFLGISAKTVKRDWSVAKAWLYGELQHN
jgi:hypothetical protein